MSMYEQTHPKFSIYYTEKNMQVYFNYSIKFTKPQAPETAADTL